jgi:hypothetical protein
MPTKLFKVTRKMAKLKVKIKAMGLKRLGRPPKMS